MRTRRIDTTQHTSEERTAPTPRFCVHVVKSGTTHACARGRDTPHTQNTGGGGGAASARRRGDIPVVPNGPHPVWESGRRWGGPEGLPSKPHGGVPQNTDIRYGHTTGTHTGTPPTRRKHNTRARALGEETEPQRGCRNANPPRPLPCPPNNKVLKSTVRTGMFVGHAVRYLINSVPKSGTQLFGSQNIRSERKCSLDEAFVGHKGGGVTSRGRKQR